MDILTCPHCGASGEAGVHSKGRYVCSSCSRTFRPRAGIGDMPSVPLSGGRYVITTAISGSLVHPGFLKSLLTLCRERQAQLVIIPIRYHNPTSRFDSPGEWFDERIYPFICNERTEIVPGLMLMADVPTQPTAARPLSGLQAFGGQASAIFGHPKIALESVATQAGKYAKLVMTTGAITRAEYSSSKAGKKGEFHHVLGALVVETKGKEFHVRHVHAQADGSLYDLEGRFGPAESSASPKAAVLTCGDLHAIRTNREVAAATFFRSDSICAVTKPDNIVLHDVLDFQSASHHTTFFEGMRLHTEKRTSVMHELEETASLLWRILEATDAKNVVVVPSNHHDHFTRWLQNPANASDKENAYVWRETGARYIEAIEQNAPFDPLEYWVHRLLGQSARLTFLGRNDSWLISNVEHSQHGDVGPNGAKGAIRAFVSVGAKMTIGHSHTPGIMDGVYQVGTSSELDMGYNQGLSSWMHTHCLQYTNGRRALINIINGRWRLSEVVK